MEEVAKYVNVNVKQKRGEIRAMSDDCVVVSGCKSIKDFFQAGVEAAWRPPAPRSLRIRVPTVRIGIARAAGSDSVE